MRSRIKHDLSPTRWLAPWLALPLLLACGEGEEDAAAGAAALQGEELPAQSGGAPPGEAQPGEEDTRPRLVATGVVEPQGSELRLATDDHGRVDSIHVHLGRRVEAGALLAQLSHGREDAALAAAQASLLEARARLAQAQRGRTTQEIAAAAAEAQRAEAASELATQELSRREALHGSGAISTEEMERAEGEARGASSALQARSAQYRALILGRRTELAVAQAQVDAAAAAVAAAHAAIHRREIVAPIAGRILEIRYHVGEYYDPESGGPLLLLGNTQGMRIRAEVDERDRPKVAIGAEAFVRLGVHDPRRFRGHVREIGGRVRDRELRGHEQRVGPHGRVVEVWIELEEEPQLVAGQGVIVEIVESQPQGEEPDESASDEQDSENSE